MAIAIRPVEAPGAAQDASKLLNTAWKIPAIDYSPEYLTWQLSFPAPWPLPAAMAFSGFRPVGFAAASCRYLRFGSKQFPAAIVSFVCVDPEMQGRGIAAGLYDCLLSEIRSLGCPVMTWGAPGSAGQRILEQAYERNGYTVRPLGSYAVYAGMARRNEPNSVWQITQDPTPEALRDCLESCLLQDPELIWSDPHEEQQHQHYQLDPRGRRVLMATHSDSGVSVAAYAFQAHLRTVKGTEYVTTLDSVLAPRSCPEAVGVLLQAAGEVWSGPIVTATSLHGFLPEHLRAGGIRQTAAGYKGYLCFPKPFPDLEAAQGTTIEVI